MDKDTLHEIELHIFQMIIDFATYAGNAFLSDDKEMMNLFKGQYIGLMRLQKWVAEKYLRACQKEDREKEKKTYAAHVKEQMATLLPHDHRLLDEIVRGLQEEGWVEEGGSPTFRLLHKQGAAIKIFRDAEAPQVIKICFSAEPEEEHNDWPEVAKCPKCGHLTDVTNKNFGAALACCNCSYSWIYKEDEKESKEEKSSL